MTLAIIRYVNIIILLLRDIFTIHQKIEFCRVSFFSCIQMSRLKNICEFIILNDFFVEAMRKIQNIGEEYFFFFSFCMLGIL